jgi:hypothetical protein
MLPIPTFLTTFPLSLTSGPRLSASSSCYAYTRGQRRGRRGGAAGEGCRRRVSPHGAGGAPCATAAELTPPRPTAEVAPLQGEDRGVVLSVGRQRRPSRPPAREAGGGGLASAREDGDGGLTPAREAGGGAPRAASEAGSTHEDGSRDGRGGEGVVQARRRRGRQEDAPGRGRRGGAPEMEERAGKGVGGATPRVGKN